MLNNHLKIAFRNLKNHRCFKVLNLFSLAIGLVVLLSLMLFVRHEVSFDINADNIFRVNLNVSYENKREIRPSASNIAGPANKEGIKEVKEYARLLHHHFGRAAFVTTGEELWGK